MLPKKSSNIGLFRLILLIAVSIDSVRNLPSTALFGSKLIFLYLLASLFLLIPGSIAAAEFAFAFPKQGGIFHWVSLGLGKRIGFLAVWGQWVNTLVWFPTILSFIASSLAYSFKPEWTTSSHYMVIATISCFSALTLLSLRGFKASSKVASFCALFGLLLPMAFIIVLALIWIITGRPIQIDFSMHHLLPNMHSMTDWFSLVAIMTSFEGFELVAVYMNYVDHPKRNFPRAMFSAVLIILTTMVLGSLAVAIIIPQQSIQLVDGVAQGFSAFLAAYHMKALLPVLLILMAMGSLGEMINWLSAPARGLFQASEDGFLPKFFQQKNRFGVERNLLVFQAVMVSLVSLMFVTNINSAYWFLTNLSVEIYMLVYLLMFISAIVVEHRLPDRQRLYTIFKHRWSLNIVYIFGIIGCLVTLVIGAFPPDTINVGSHRTYQLYFWLGMIICLVIPTVGLYYYQGFQKNKTIAN